MFNSRLLWRHKNNSLFPHWFNDDEEWGSELTARDGLDVYETDNEVVVKAAVPGVPEDKVEVTFEDGVLRIQARIEETEEDKKKRKVTYRRERMLAFDYTTTLPRSIRSEEISAEVENGVVTVTAPISPESKPKRISVKTRGQ